MAKKCDDIIYINNLFIIFSFYITFIEVCVYTHVEES